MVILQHYTLWSGMITKLLLINKMNCLRAELFLYDDHFSTIRDTSQLLSAEIGKRGHAKYFCDYCDNGLSSQEELNKHMMYCKDHSFITVKYLPRNKEGGVPLVKFKNTIKMVCHPIMITADFESLLLKVNEKHGENTTRFQVHKASCVGMYIPRFDGKNEYFTFCGPN